jgi:hypothetical protein
VDALRPSNAAAQGASCADDALLLAASARAHGQLAALSVPRRGRLSHAALLVVARANAGALRELRLLWRHDEDEVSCTTTVTPSELSALLEAAPQLRVCHTRVYTLDDAAEVAAAAENTHRMLRGDGAFACVRIHALSIADVDEGCMATLGAFVASHPTLTRLSIWHTAADATPVLEAAAAQTSRLTQLGLWRCNVNAATASALAAVIRCGALRRAAASVAL